MSGENGSASVIADAITGVAAGIAGARAAADGEQIEAFEIPGTNVGLRDGGALDRARDQQRRRGRPPGAANKSTAAFRAWILARAEHPLQWMARWAEHTPESLAAELGCTKLEAFDRLAALRRELAPYFASRMVPVDDQGRPVPYLQMNIGGVVMTPQAGAVAPWLQALAQIEQNQALSEPARGVSHGAVLDGSAK